MAKGIGLIGNFRGKVGNMVGYNLKDSNNKQTQGVRVYQPVVKNPKTYGQAEQRAKLAPINATYRALKAIIDRGQEGKAYGNKSRLAWLSDAMKAFNGGWFEKGAVITAPALVPLTKGSLQAFPAFTQSSDAVTLEVTAPQSGGVTTVGALATAILSKYPWVQEGDQVTFVYIDYGTDLVSAQFASVLIDTTSTDALPAGMTYDAGSVLYAPGVNDPATGAIILSREGSNGAHLRSTTSLVQFNTYDSTVMTPEAKEAAIKSYMAAGANTDWAEESLQ